MNLLHMKYAVEIAETKSINKAVPILVTPSPTTIGDKSRGNAF